MTYAFVNTYGIATEINSLDEAVAVFEDAAKRLPHYPAARRWLKNNDTKQLLKEQGKAVLLAADESFARAEYQPCVIGIFAIEPNKIIDDYHNAAMLEVDGKFKNYLDAQERFVVNQCKPIIGDIVIFQGDDTEYRIDVMSHNGEVLQVGADKLDSYGYYGSYAGGVSASGAMGLINPKTQLFKKIGTRRVGMWRFFKERAKGNNGIYYQAEVACWLAA